MTLEEILNLEGVVIRKIPASTTSRWSYSGLPLGKNEKLVFVDCLPSKTRPDGKRPMIEKVETNSLAGYAIAFCHNQDSTIRFHKESTGFGKSIKEAYDNLITKTK